MNLNAQKTGNINSNGNVSLNNNTLNSLSEFYPNLNPISEGSMNFPNKSFYKVKEKRAKSLDNKNNCYSGKKMKLNYI